MKILVYINKSNNVIIDPNITINSNAVNSYKACFSFQVPWDSNLKLFAVFKPANDVPVKLELDSNFECNIPPQLYKRFAKLGIGLVGVYKTGEVMQEQQCTNLFYIPIKYSGL